MNDTAMREEATARPWAADPDDRDGMEWNVHIVDASEPDNRIAFMSNGPRSVANAALIVRAVNSYDAMREALQMAADYISKVSDRFDGNDTEGFHAAEVAERAIRAALSQGDGR